MSVDVASNLEEALSLANTIHYDLVIVDYFLDAEHNGLELVEKIKNNGPNQQTPCIVLSAEDVTTGKEEAKNVGIKAWLKKPFSPTGLIETVDQVLANNKSDKL